MPSFVHSPGRECPWQGRGTRQVLHIPRSAVQEIYTIKANTSLRRAHGAGPEGVRLRERGFASDL